MSDTARSPMLREQLLDAAEQVLDRHGAAAVTTRRIAAEAGCSEGSIYNNFRNKEELLACVVTERIARFPVKVSELASDAGNGDVREHLEEIARSAVAFFRRGMPMLTFAAHDAGAVRAQCRELHDAGHGPRRTAEDLAAWIRAEQQLGRVHAEADPDGVASSLLGSCMFHVMVSTTWGLDAPVDDTAAIDRAVTALWRGLAPN